MGAKRNRGDHARVPSLALAGTPLLRCPWCADGLLFCPGEAEDSVPDGASTGHAAEGDGFICTNRAACPYNEVLAQDCTIAFSGISGQVLLRHFYAALDAHLKRLQGKRQGLDAQGGWCSGLEHCGGAEPVVCGAVGRVLAAA
ncbi:uncharacterized protein Tco025E_04599 [Trypanosoma conorhini]|uniref:Uncharacterized protein n=1 Tax=Trypanosoma conorhini TaxID=83891 RepID=A0A3R7N8T6_9TRYP|nr:uncharacterized protein Tco025E_04599 [Trypanosoma conorhini]RNF18214.1 hypothetical protein Tco025E_04599 [Trypanosoma conorhini]